MVNDEPGPNLNDLHLDIHGGLASDWNKRAFYLLRTTFLKELEELNDVPARTEQYFEDLITEQFGRLVTIWNHSQPKRKADGVMESFEEVENQMNQAKTKQLVVNHHTVRRFTVSLIRDFVEVLSEISPRFCRSSIKEFISLNLKYAQPGSEVI